MFKRFIMGVIVGVMAIATPAGNSYSDAPSYAGEPSSNFMRQWLLCGPFPNPEAAYDRMDREESGFYLDYLQEVGGEAGADLQTGAGIEFQGREYKWFEYESDHNNVYLDKAVSSDPFVLAYAYSEIQSTEEKPCILAVGSNDGIRIWLNGEEVLDVPERRGLRVDDNLIPVILKKGRNTLLLKIAETENLWGFSCRFMPFQTSLLEGEQSFFRVHTDQDGQAILNYTGSLALAEAVFDDAEMAIYPISDPGRAVWRCFWPGTRNTLLDIDAEEYGEYELRITFALSDGGKREINLPIFVGKRKEYSLFQSGKTEYSIVIGEGASDSERWAASELQQWLKEISGADFPLRTDDETLKPHEIVVGWNRHSQALLHQEGDAGPDPMDESFTYRNVGPSIVIWGGKTRGTQYGVFTFLENELGCRWYTPLVSVIPEKDHFTFHYLHHSESPGIRVRNDFYYEAFDPIWAARNKVNGAMGYREQPGGLECYWAVHTFFPLVPPDEFYEEHPEYYSLIDGKRVYQRAQLCLTNPDVLRIVTERILERIRQNPEYLIYSVSQNDWAGACQCDACQAIAKREESESGPVLWFVNQVAEAVEKEFPDKYIGTLAYQYTRKPCKTIRPRKNVVIRLCSIECCFAHDFEHCPENESFVRDIKGWAAIAPKLYIWDYVVNFSHYIMPYPNFRVLQPNIQFFRDHNAIGIMEQAAYQSRGGEFAELRSYLISKLLWNPECDVEAVIDDFMYG
ncbi:MAG: DUF4838 domain-containing protein, partial [Candidatus Hinthialibacter sp.]